MQNSRKISAVTFTMALLLAVAFQQVYAQIAVTAVEARAIAKEAYIYANPLVDSYRIFYGLNSPMLPNFTRDTDGGITLYIQHDSPIKPRGPNWLPAPNGPFSVVMRLYWPEADALDGTWKLPQLTRVPYRMGYWRLFGATKPR